MQRIVAAAGEHLIDVDEVANTGNLAADDDLVVAEAVTLGSGGGVECRAAHGFEHHVARGCGVGTPRVFVHEASQQRLVERAPVDADAHRLVVLDRALNHGAEIVVVFAADGDIAGIDAVLGKRLGAGGVFLEQQVAVVVEVTDDRRVDAALREAFDNVRDGLGGLVVVDGDADEFGAGFNELGDLLDGRGGIGRVGVGHGLHDDGSLGADFYASDANGNRLPALNFRHGEPQ